MQREAYLCGSDYENASAVFADDASTTVSGGSAYDDTHALIGHATGDWPINTLPVASPTRNITGATDPRNNVASNHPEKTQMINEKTPIAKIRWPTADSSQLQYINTSLEKDAAGGLEKPPPLLSRVAPEGSGYVDAKVSSSVQHATLEKSADVANPVTTFQLNEPSMLESHQDKTMRANILALHNDTVNRYDEAMSAKVTNDITNFTFSIHDLEEKADVIQCQCVEAFRLACLRYGTGRNVQRYVRFYETKLKAAMELSKELLVERYIVKLQQIVEEHHSNCSKDLEERDQSLREKHKEIVRLQKHLDDGNARNFYVIQNIALKQSIY